MDAEEIEVKEKISSSYEQYPSPFQEYFPIQQNVKCGRVMAAFKADVPPVFKAVKNDAFYARHVVKRSKVHQIKQLTQRDQRSVPPNALNTWRDLTPDVKLPDIRNRTQGDIYYTRGKLGEKLNRSKPEFDLSDPVNKRKVLETEKYSSLHDPHCRSYFLRPSVQRHLRKQKLINCKNEVLCDVHEFNKFRSYLGELFGDQVKRRIGDNNAMEDMQRGLTKAVCAKQRRRQDEANKQFQLKHREMNLAYREAQRKRFAANIQTWRRRLQQIESYRSQVKLAHTGQYTIKHWNAYITRQKAATAEEGRKQHTLIRIAYAETKNDYVTKYDKFVRLALLERYKADQTAVMVARDDQIDDMEQLVEETLRRARISWLKKYDTFIEHCRSNPLSHYQALLKQQHRKKFLMRKYFYKWVQYVIRLRDARPNESHRSIFQVERKLKPFVENLKEFSPSDFEPDEDCGAGDQECKTKKLKKITKFMNLAKIFPNRDATTTTASKAKLQGSAGAATNLTIQLSVGGGAIKEANDQQMESDEIRRKKKKLKMKRKKEKEEEDGNEADVEEPDDFIDKMVARYKLDQDQLKIKLQRIPPSRWPTLGDRLYVPKELQTVSGQFDNAQEDQKDTISFLKDINREITTSEKMKGWKAMKL